MTTSATGNRPRRSRGIAAAEYIVVALIMCVACIGVWRRWGTHIKCRMDGAAHKLSFGSGSSDGADACSDDSGSGGAGGGAVAANDAKEPDACVGGACMMGSGNCFVAGTLVQTAEGLRPIETITAGMLVLARDQNGDALDWKPVARAFQHRAPALVTLDLGEAGDAETIEVTPTHLLFSKERGWLPAEQLTPGQDSLVDAGGHDVRVRGVASAPGDVTVYNFEVADYHTYFVGQHSFWAHNTCPHGNDYHCASCGDDEDGNLTGPSYSNNPSGDNSNCFNCAVGADYTLRTGNPTIARPNPYGRMDPSPYTVSQGPDLDRYRGPYAPPPRYFSSDNSGSASQHLASYIEARPYSQGVVALDYNGFGHAVNAAGGGGRPAEIYDPQVGSGVGRTIDIDGATYYETNYASRPPPSSRVSYAPPARGSLPRITTGLANLSLDDPPPRNPRPGSGYRVAKPKPKYLGRMRRGDVVRINGREVRIPRDGKYEVEDGKLYQL